MKVAAAPTGGTVTHSAWTPDIGEAEPGQSGDGHVDGTAIGEGQASPRKHITKSTASPSIVTRFCWWLNGNSPEGRLERDARLAAARAWLAQDGPMVFPTWVPGHRWLNSLGPAPPDEEGGGGVLSLTSSTSKTELTPEERELAALTRIVWSEERTRRFEEYVPSKSTQAWTIIMFALVATGLALPIHIPNFGDVEDGPDGAAVYYVACVFAGIICFQLPACLVWELIRIPMSNWFVVKVLLVSSVFYATLVWVYAHYWDWPVPLLPISAGFPGFSCALVLSMLAIPKDLRFLKKTLALVFMVVVVSSTELIVMGAWTAHRILFIAVEKQAGTQLVVAALLVVLKYIFRWVFARFASYSDPDVTAPFVFLVEYFNAVFSAQLYSNAGVLAGILLVSVDVVGNLWMLLRVWRHVMLPRVLGRVLEQHEAAAAEGRTVKVAPVAGTPVRKPRYHVPPSPHVGASPSRQISRGGTTSPNESEAVPGLASSGTGGGSFGRAPSGEGKGAPFELGRDHGVRVVHVAEGSISGSDSDSDNEAKQPSRGPARTGSGMAESSRSLNHEKRAGTKLLLSLDRTHSMYGIEAVRRHLLRRWQLRMSEILVLTEFCECLVPIQFLLHRTITQFAAWNKKNLVGLDVADTSDYLANALWLGILIVVELLGFTAVIYMLQGIQKTSPLRQLCFALEEHRWLLTITCSQIFIFVIALGVKQGGAELLL